MHKLSRRIEELSESQTLAMAQKSWELQAQGIDVVNLSIGEPDFYTPDYIKDAAKKAIDANFSFYSPVAGYKDLREAISKKFKTENNLDYAPNQIVVSNGAKQSITNAVLCLVDHGDEVIIPVPYWVSYKEMVLLAGGKCVFVGSTVEQNYKFPPADLEKAITPKTRLMFFNSPSNPSGSVFSLQEMKEIADVLAKHENIYIISDEIYEHINFVGKHESFAQFENIRDRVITINGVSKGYAMPGWRIGYMGAAKWISSACEKLQSQYTSGPCSISQRAAFAALTHGDEFTQEMNRAFRHRRDLVVSFLKTIPEIKYYIPEGAFYVLPDVSAYFGRKDGDTVIKNADDLSLYLLNKAHVSTVSGAAFGTPDCIRFSYANTDELITSGMIRIKDALVKLK